MAPSESHLISMSLSGPLSPLLWIPLCGLHWPRVQQQTCLKGTLDKCLYAGHLVAVCGAARTSLLQDETSQGERSHVSSRLSPPQPNAAERVIPGESQVPGAQPAYRISRNCFKPPRCGRFALQQQTTAALLRWFCAAWAAVHATFSFK